MNRSTKLLISRAKGMVDAQTTSTVTKFVSSQQQAIYTFINEIVDDISANTDPEDYSVGDDEACEALTEAASLLANIAFEYSPTEYEEAIAQASDLLSDAKS